MARPSKITERLITNFCSSLYLTGSIETAIADTGIGRESYFRWKRRVVQGTATKLERQFMEAVDRAAGESKQLLESKMSKHYDKSWRSIAWWLERKYPNEYGKRRPPPLPDPDDF
jgi:transposase